MQRFQLCNKDWPYCSTVMEQTRLDRPEYEEMVYTKGTKPIVIQNYFTPDFKNTHLHKQNEVEMKPLLT